MCEQIERIQKFLFYLNFKHLEKENICQFYQECMKFESIALKY